jgi:hypothetical protein
VRRNLLIFLACLAFTTAVLVLAQLGKPVLDDVGGGIPSAVENAAQEH